MFYAFKGNHRLWSTFYFEMFCGFKSDHFLIQLQSVQKEIKMQSSRRASISFKSVKKPAQRRQSVHVNPERPEGTSRNELHQDIITMYKKYEDKSTKWSKTKVNGETFQLPSYYQVCKQIGVGSYGAVIAAIDKRTSSEAESQVAIKKMTNVFEHKIFARRILRQLRTLRLLKHQNIVQIKTIILPKSRKQFNEIYVVFPLMDFDMRTVLKSPIQLNEEYCQFYIYQILRALKYIHSANIMHRDIKPRNILLNDENDLKVCDFGLARFSGKSIKNANLTDYVTTRWYRAPQVLLGCENYSPAVDIWSTGCIFAEIFTKQPFLQAGDTKNQLALIMKTLGIQKVNNEYHKTAEDSLDKVFQKISTEGRDMLKKMLTFDPKRRITAAEALRHPYMQQLHIEQDEPECESMDEVQFEFEQVELTTEQLKDILYQQILLYHFPGFKREYEQKKKEKISLIGHIVKNSNATKIDPRTDSNN